MEVTKAYDLSELKDIVVEEIKKDGLDALEAAAKSVSKSSYSGIKKWLKGSAVVSTFKLDDYIAPFYDQLDQMILPGIDKISFKPKQP